MMTPEFPMLTPELRAAWAAVNEAADRVGEAHKALAQAEIKYRAAWTAWEELVLATEGNAKGCNE